MVWPPEGVVHVWQYFSLSLIRPGSLDCSVQQHVCICFLLFTNIDRFIDGIIMTGVISLILISLILLIKDMDDPFEVGKKTYADIDLSLMYKLEERIKTL